MKTSIRMLGTALALMTLLFCSSKPTGSQATKATASPSVQIMWEPEESAWSPASRDQIMRIIGSVEQETAGINALSTSIELPVEAIDKITKLHGKHGAFVAPDGKIHDGSENILKHLNDNKSKIKKFRIQLKFVYAKEFTEVFNNAAGNPKDVVHNLIFVFSSSYEYDGKLVDPPSTASCSHVRLCDCDKGI